MLPQNIIFVNILQGVYRNADIYFFKETKTCCTNNSLCNKIRSFETIIERDESFNA